MAKGKTSGDEGAFRNRPLSRPQEFLTAVRNKKLKELKTITEGARKFLDKLLNDDSVLDHVMRELAGRPKFVSKIAKAVNSSDELDGDALEEAIGILKELQKYEVDSDAVWENVVGGRVMMNGKENVLEHLHHSGFSQDAASWLKNPAEIENQLKVPASANVPAYTAFSGASGSGKTHTMLHTLEAIILKKIPFRQKCLKYYISCNPPEGKTLFEYVSHHIKSTMDDLLGIHNCKLEQLSEQCKSTWLVLVLDEVQSRFTHDEYFRLPSELINEHKFERVVLLVGSTALSQDVCQQPTDNNEVLNIRMKPLDEKDMGALLLGHLHRQKRIGINDSDLPRLVQDLFREMPVLFDLLSNHRCAYLTAGVLSELLGSTPFDGLPAGWGQGHSAALVAMVACRYRACNGLRVKRPAECTRLMLESLALLAAQPVIGEEGVVKAPSGDSLAAKAMEVVEIGLVEIAILPDEKVIGNDNNVKVDGFYEFQMSPALTLLCVREIMPSIEGIYHAADHFEALVATLMVVMRYAQTNNQFMIHRLEQAVPYSGNEDHLYNAPDVSIAGQCTINGPQAPYGDLMVGPVPPGDIPPQAGRLAHAINHLVCVAQFPVDSMIVQCKLSSERQASCTFKNEYAKMGYVAPEGAGRGLESPKINPYRKGTQLHKQYGPARWLTNHWAKEGDWEKSVSIGFATNKVFAEKVQTISNVFLMEAEGECSHAWQKLYPVIQLVRQDCEVKIGRKKREPVEVFMDHLLECHKPPDLDLTSCYAFLREDPGHWIYWVAEAGAAPAPAAVNSLGEDCTPQRTAARGKRKPEQVNPSSEQQTKCVKITVENCQAGSDSRPTNGQSQARSHEL